jgi:hemoglobin/transferrin/lactoferrin receptor protein
MGKLTLKNKKMLKQLNKKQKIAMSFMLFTGISFPGLSQDNNRKIDSVKTTITKDVLLLDSLKGITLKTVDITYSEIATRTKRKLDQISKSITIINQNDIDVLSPVNVQGFLDNVPGVSYSRSGGLGGQIVMRGFNSNTPRTLLLIDGDRFRGRNTLEFNLLDPNQIERIEILRGPNSTLYGPDAMAGVINVITRKAKGNVHGPIRFKPVLRNVDYNTLNNLLGIRGEAQLVGKGFDALLGASYRKANDVVTPIGKIANSDFESLQLDLKAGYTFGKSSSRIELTGKYGEAKSGRAGGIGAAPGGTLIVQRENPLKENYAKLAFYGKSKILRLNRVEACVYARSLYSNLTTTNTTKKNQVLESVNIVDGPLVLGGKLFGVREWKKGVFTAGIDNFYEIRKGSSSSSIQTNLNAAGSPTAVITTTLAQNSPNSTQADLGVFLRHDWDPTSMWTISAGARVDCILSTTETSPVISPTLQSAYDANQKNEVYPLTGELGIIFKPIKMIHLTANVGNSFRSPSTVESFGSSRQGTGFNIPNPNLKPEDGITYEAGIRFAISKLNINLTGFQSDYSNFITRQPITFQGLPSFQNQNTGKARVQGVEMDLNWFIFNNWNFFGNASFYEGTDLSLNKPLSYIPPFRGIAALRYTLSNKSAYVELASSGSLKKERIDDLAERTSPSYAILNFRLGYDLGSLHKKMPPITLRMGLENIFNTTYRLPTTVENIAYVQGIANPLAEPGRYFFVSLKFGLIK